MTSPLTAELTDGARTEFYSFLPRGHVELSLKKASGTRSFASEANRGCRFQQAFTLFVFWPQSGQVVEAKLVSVFSTNLGGSINITIDGRAATLRLLT